MKPSRMAEEHRTASVPGVSHRLISVPYVVGREGTGMGAGPLALAPGVARLLGVDDVRRLALSEPAPNEVAACFDLNRQLAAAIADAVRDGAVPVVLTGNCHSQQAVVAGLGTDGLGLVWLDSHADFHTPETTTTGFFDGYGLAMVTGDCWASLCATVPGFRPLPEERAVLVGARDVDDGERERLAASRVARTDDPAAHLAGAERVSLHVDLDVLDPSVGRANAWANPGGMSVDELIATVRAVAAALPIAALTLSAYDPAYDFDHGVREAALAVVAAVRG